LPGNFFLVEGQKKGSINHCYLSVAITRSAHALAACIASLTRLAAPIYSKNRARGAMADKEQAEGNVAEAAEVPAPKGKLKLMIAAAAVLLMVVVVAATWFLFFRHSGDEMHAEASPAKPPVFLEVPDMLVNLSGSHRRARAISQGQDRARGQGGEAARGDQADDAARHRYFPDLPARAAGRGDLNGSAGLFRLKEELTRRVNTVISPSQVNAVLFKEIVIQ